MNKVRLGDIATFINGDRGKNYPSQADIIDDGEIPFVNAGHLNGRTIDFEEMNYISQEKYNRLNSGKFVKGDVLYCLRGSLGKKAIVTDNIKGAIASSLVIIRPNYNFIDGDYLMFSLDSPSIKEQLKKANNGSSQPNLSAASVRDYQIELPDIKIQKAVVNKLSKVRAIIDKRQQETLLLDDLIKARFVEMFGDPETGTVKYNSEKLGELSVKISDGVHAKPKYTETGRPFLSVVNINKGVVDFTDCKYVSEEAYQKMIKSTYPEKGDVLYTKVGATYGIPAYIDTDKEFCIYVSVCLIKPKHEKINSRFLAIQMGMPSVKHQADDRIKGIGVPDLHLNQIREFDVICPPREKQDAFVDFVKQVDKSKIVVQKALDETRLLFDSLMQKYFG